MTANRRAHPVARSARVPPGSHIVVEVAGREIGIFNIHGRYYALPNVCPHQNGPLCHGRLTGTLSARSHTGWQPEWTHDGEVIVCPWHSLEFNVTTGECLAWPDRPLPVYEVHEREGILEVIL